MYKIKITDDGVAIVKTDGLTEEIPALPGEQFEVVEGVFKKAVGKKLGINFHNNIGKICLILIYLKDSLVNKSA